MSERALRIGLPVLVLALGLLAWDLVVRAFAIPPFVLPGPGLVLSTLIADGGLLWQSLLVTLATTFEGFLLAAIGGIGLAILFSQSRLIEYSLYPYAVILQVTPIVAIAPLLLIYLPQPVAVLACAWIVAFFPVLANTTLGLSSVDKRDGAFRQRNVAVDASSPNRRAARLRSNSVRSNSRSPTKMTSAFHPDRGSMTLNMPRAASASTHLLPADIKRAGERCGESLDLGGRRIHDDVEVVRGPRLAVVGRRRRAGQHPWHARVAELLGESPRRNAAGALTAFRRCPGRPSKRAPHRRSA